MIYIPNVNKQTKPNMICCRFHIKAANLYVISHCFRVVKLSNVKMEERKKKTKMQIIMGVGGVNCNGVCM